MEKFTFFLSYDYLTIRLGRALGSVCFPGCIIYLNGHIGVGKTTLCKGFLFALGYNGIVKSPTYTLIESYKVNCWIVHHFDFYRIINIEELEYLGIQDCFKNYSICLIEWAIHGLSILPNADISITISHLVNYRKVVLESFSFIGDKILMRLSSLQGLFL